MTKLGLVGIVLSTILTVGCTSVDKYNYPPSKAQQWIDIYMSYTYTGTNEKN